VPECLKSGAEDTSVRFGGRGGKAGKKDRTGKIKNGTTPGRGGEGSRGEKGCPLSGASSGERGGHRENPKAGGGKGGETRKVGSCVGTQGRGQTQKNRGLREEKKSGKRKTQLAASKKNLVVSWFFRKRKKKRCWSKKRGKLQKLDDLLHG